MISNNFSIDYDVTICIMYFVCIVSTIENTGCFVAVKYYDKSKSILYALQGSKNYPIYFYIIYSRCLVETCKLEPYHYTT